MSDAALHMVTDLTAKALDAVQGLAESADGNQVDRAQFGEAQTILMRLALTPGASAVLPGLAGLMAALVIDLAYATGRTPAEIVAEQRKRTAAGINGAARLRGEQ